MTDPYTDGYNAGYVGLGAEDDPYEDSPHAPAEITPEIAEQWEAGWHQGWLDGTPYRQ